MAATSPTTTITSFEKKITSSQTKLEASTLLDAQRKNPEKDPFPHTEQLMTAIHRGLKGFSVVESFDNREALDRNKQEDILQSNVYDMNADFKLHDQSYYSLDDPLILANVKEISRETVTYCDHVNVPTVGDFFVGTSEGSWSSYWKEDYSTHGLSFSRKVVGLSSSTTGCVSLVTEDIPALHLFDSFKVNTIAPMPYTHHHPTEKRRLHNQLAVPDSPAYACAATKTDDTYFQFSSGQSDDVKVEFGTDDNYMGLKLPAKKSACASMSHGANAFNFNYNVATQSAEDDAMEIANGVVCNNCYAFLGATFYMVLEYKVGVFNMEAKIIGQIAFNVAIDIKDPSITKTVKIALISPGEPTTWVINEVYGLSMDMTFKGMIATLTGTVSATGTASTSAGASASTTIGVMYAAKELSVPTGTSINIIAPTASSSAWSPATVGVTLELTATEEFALTWGLPGLSSNVELAVANFDVEINGNLEYQWINHNAPAATMSVTATASAATATVITNTVITNTLPAIPTFSAGDTIDVSVDFSDFNAGSTVELFVNFHRDDFISRTGTSVKQSSFVVPSTGSGNVVISYVIPWDIRFLQNSAGPLIGCSISVHASNHMSEIVKSSKFNVAVDDQMSGIFYSPAAGAVLVANSSVEVSWDASLLSFYQSIGGAGHGYDVKTQFVNIDLVREELSSTGEVVTSTVTEVLHAVNNTGIAQFLILPVDEALTSTRFFFVVKSTEFAMCQGWSKGYFHVVNMPSNSLRSRTLSQALISSTAASQVATNSNKAHHLFGNRLITMENANLLSSQSVQSSSCVQTCSNQLTYSVTADANFNSVDIGCFSIAGYKQCLDNFRPGQYWCR